MKSNESKLIKCAQSKTLTAYGYKLLKRLKQKAATANGANIRFKQFRDTIGVKIDAMFYDLVFIKCADEKSIISFINGIDATAKPIKIEHPNTIDVEILQ